MPNSQAIAAAVAPVAESIVAAAVSPRQTWYAINRKAETADEVEVLIYDEIGAWGIDAQSFVTAIRGIDAKRINVRLNTPGGDVFDGTAIHNALRSHPAEVVMFIEGVAASAGSFIAMAGDEIQMANNAYLMIHNSAGGVMGGADDMRSYAELLGKIDRNIAMMYAEKSGKSVDHYRELMDAETWFTADEAKAEGLVDRVYAAKPAGAPARARACSAVYNKIPAGVRRMWGIDTNNQAPEAPARSDAPPLRTQESSPMSEPNQAAPAPTPAAGPASTQGNPPTITEAENRRQEMVRLNGQTIENFIAQGRQAGHGDGVKAERQRCKEIAESCPGNPQMAIEAILSGHNPESVRLAFAAAVRVEERAKAEAEERERELARWKNLASTGGYPNGVSAGFAASAEDEGEPEKMEWPAAKARAESEWEQKPSLRKRFTSKDRYVNARAAELTGQLRMAVAPAPSAN